MPLYPVSLLFAIRSKARLPLELQPGRWRISCMTGPMSGDKCHWLAREVWWTAQSMLTLARGQSGTSGVTQSKFSAWQVSSPIR